MEDKITRYKLHKVKTKWVIIGTTLCGSVLAGISTNQTAKADALPNNNVNISDKSDSSNSTSSVSPNEDLVKNSGLASNSSDNSINSNNLNSSSNNKAGDINAGNLAGDNKANNVDENKNAATAAGNSSSNLNANKSAATNNASNSSAKNNVNEVNESNVSSNSLNGTSNTSDKNTNLFTTSETTTASVSNDNNKNDSKQINPFNNIPGTNSSSSSATTNTSTDDGDYTTIVINGKTYKTPTKKGLQKMQGSSIPLYHRALTGSALNNVTTANGSHIIRNNTTNLAAEVSEPNKEITDNNKLAQNQTVNISEFNTDKSSYNPGDTVKITANIKNDLDVDQFGTYKLNVFSPLTKEYTISSGQWKANKNGGTDSITFDWKTPNVDNQGYILNLQLFTTEGKIVGEYNDAVDVNTDWRKHPRYGALTNFSDDSQTGTDGAKLDVNTLSQKYHMNVAMLYDCYFRPQNPIPSDMNSYKDWHGDTISVDLIKQTIDQLHNNGSKAMLYDMINATTGFPGDPHSAMEGDNWSTNEVDGHKAMAAHDGLFYAGMQNQVNSKMGSDPDTQIQYYYDSANPDWQNYIIPRIKATLDYMNFDGWQGDTPGQITGTTYANRGTNNTITDSDFYHYFVDAAKKGLGDKQFGMNAVNAAGQHAIATQSHSDWDYSELWPSSYKTYYDIAKVIEQNWKDDGKSLITPVYFMDQWRNDASNGKGDALPKYYNDNAVRQLIATIMANGGAPMVLADNGRLLDDEYYPWPRMQEGKQISMDNDLGNANTGYVRHYYDFQTAYENLLQNPDLKLNDNFIQVWDGGAVGKGNFINRNDGEANTVYAFSKSNGTDTDTINMVNLMGTTNQWQVYNNDDNNNHNVKTQTNLWVKYYPSIQDKDIKHIYISSPDNPYESKRTELPFIEEKDQSGNRYVAFQVPSLDIWDLIYMTTNDPQPLSLVALPTTNSSTSTPTNTTNSSNSSSSSTSSDITKPTTNDNGSSSSTSSTTNNSSSNSSSTNSDTTKPTTSDNESSNSTSSTTTNNNDSSSSSTNSDTTKPTTSDNGSSNSTPSTTTNNSSSSSTTTTPSTSDTNDGSSDEEDDVKDKYNYLVTYYDGNGNVVGTYNFYSSASLNGKEITEKVKSGTKENVIDYDTDQDVTDDGNVIDTISAYVGEYNDPIKSYRYEVDYLDDSGQLVGTATINSDYKLSCDELNKQLQDNLKGRKVVSYIIDSENDSKGEEEILVDVTTSQDTPTDNSSSSDSTSGNGSSNSTDTNKPATSTPSDTNSSSDTTKPNEDTNTNKPSDSTSNSSSSNESKPTTSTPSDVGASNDTTTKPSENTGTNKPSDSTSNSSSSNENKSDGNTSSNVGSSSDTTKPNEDTNANKPSDSASNSNSSNESKPNNDESKPTTSTPSDVGSSSNTTKPNEDTNTNKPSDSTSSSNSSNENKPNNDESKPNTSTPSDVSNSNDTTEPNEDTNKPSDSTSNSSSSNNTTTKPNDNSSAGDVNAGNSSTANKDENNSADNVAAGSNNNKQDNSSKNDSATNNGTDTSSNKSNTSTNVSDNSSKVTNDDKSNTSNNVSDNSSKVTNDDKSNTSANTSDNSSKVTNDDKSSTSTNVSDNSSKVTNDDKSNASTNVSDNSSKVTNNDKSNASTNASDNSSKVTNNDKSNASTNASDNSSKVTNDDKSNTNTNVSDNSSKVSNVSDTSSKSISENDVQSNAYTANSNVQLGSSSNTNSENDLPQTGDNNKAKIILGALLSLGLIGLSYRGKRKED